MSRRIAMILLLSSLMAVGCDCCDCPDETIDYTQLRGGGASASVLDIVIIGDGYAESQQEEFNGHVSEIVADLGEMEPFKSWECALNIWRINLVTAAGGTALDVQYAGPGQPDRYIQGSADKCFEVCRNAGVPGYDVVFVLVNSDHYRAWTDLANSISYVTDKYPWGRLMAHELGHTIAGLGDEYTCYTCDPSVLEDPTYPAELGVPLQPNLTTHTNRTLIPWTALINATQIPTSAVSGIDTCLARSPVGAYPGGGYYKEGIYRPEQFCLMDRWMCVDETFCTVCEQAVARELEGMCE